MTLGGLILMAVVSGQADAQILTILASFNGSNGESPFAGVTLIGNTLYGTTQQGGNLSLNDGQGLGTVFSVPSSGGSPTVLAPFNGSNGSYPDAGVTLIGNTLYGTTLRGGANNDATVFSVPLSGGSPTVLASFNGSNGAAAVAGLTLIGNTLYGTTVNGGANYDGTVFSLPLSGGSPTVLTSFNGGNGQDPYAGLTLSGNTLYGTTYIGGAYGYGTVFSVPLSGGSPTVLASFNGGNGYYPVAGLTLSGNTLFGTTLWGGNLSLNGGYGFGAVFSLPLSGGSVTVLASFNGSNGANPQAGLTLSGNTLYGTTSLGGNLSLNSGDGDGTVFSLPLSGGSPTVLASFNGSNGAEPYAGLTLSGNTLYGTTYEGGAYGDGTVFALNIAPASIALSSGTSATIISGGTCTLGVTVSNSPGSGYNLNYTLNAAVLSGSATLGAITSGTGSLAPSASQSCTVPATSTTLGVTTISFTGSDPNASNSPQTSTATLTVMDHSNASLSPAAAQSTETINFGNVLRGATVPSQNFTIYNLAANASAAYTANVKLTGFSTSGSTAFQTTLANFSGLTAVSGSNGNTFTASLNTSGYMSGNATISIAASQLVDDSTLLGAGNNNNGGITVTLEGNVGNATADASNSQTAFGPALTAPVAINGSYANLESTVKATSSSGGQSMVGSTATILAGTASVPATVSMAWRTAATNPQTDVPETFVSNVLDLSGMGVVDGQTKDGSVHTNTFVLQMTYSPLGVQSRTGLSELAAAEAGLIQMDYLDLADDQWEPSVLGNFGSSNNDFVGVEPWSNDMTLGDWGVNTVNHTVWPVLDHNSQFAVTPEPSSLVLLAAGAFGLLGYGWRRRRAARRTVRPAAFDQQDAPPILSFPSQSSPASAARRVA